jgi:hypothetical protein
MCKLQREKAMGDVFVPPLSPATMRGGGNKEELETSLEDHEGEREIEID